MDRVRGATGDASLAFLAEGYTFGHRRFESHQADAFRTRLMGRPVLFLRGADASRFFYEDERFSRDGAMPRSVLHSLQDEGSVQTLAGSAHRERRSLFLRSLDADGERALTTRFEELWDAAATRRRPGERIRLLDGVSELLARAALDWLRLPATSDDVRARTAEMTAMIDGAGSFAVRNWRGRALRRRSEAWARAVVQRTRTRSPAALSRPLALLVDPTAGLDDDTAAVELLNLVRPTVAVARFVAFAGLALHRHPQWRDRVAGDRGAATAFAEEVRRTTPLFPVIGGTATRDLEWDGARIEKGDWVILDLFATDRHPAQWQDAWRFDPARHLPDRAIPAPVPPQAPGAAHVVAHVVAQGDGPMPTAHRCPGEPATRSLLTAAVGRLAAASWSVPPQNLRVNLSRMPAQPGRHGMTICWEGA